MTVLAVTNWIKLVILVRTTNNYVSSDVALFDRMLMRHDLKYTLAHINKNTGTGDNMSSFQL